MEASLLALAKSIYYYIDFMANLLLVLLVVLKVMLHETIRNDDFFSATQRFSIVATLFGIVTTLFQHCNAVLRTR